MIQISFLNINVEEFKIFPYGTYFDLTTAKSSYINSISPSDGGLECKIKLDITDVNEGFFYISQICTMHTWKTISEGKEIFFNSNGEILQDSKVLCHFEAYKINNNIVNAEAESYNIIEFFDAPFKGLLPWWDEIEFDIEFQTWFQYGLSPVRDTIETPDQTIKPILKFNWFLNCKAAKKNNEWVVLKSDASSKEYIIRSIQYFSSDDESLKPCNYKSLYSTIKEFRIQNPELLTNYK